MHATFWHHPLLVLADASPFLVVDRGGPGDNLEEVAGRDVQLDFAPDSILGTDGGTQARRCMPQNLREGTTQ